MTDQPPASPWDDAETPVEEHRFPCDNCGSDFRFDPDDGRLVCDHCGNARDFTDSDNVPALIELDFRAAVANQLAATEIEEIRVSECPSCGAQVEFSPELHATECPFCATPVVTDTGTHRQIKPKGVLPFKLDEGAAREAMTHWLGRLWFAPNGLQEYARKGRKLDGIYVPYWTYDADTRTQYRGQRGDAYYVTRTVMRDGKPHQVRERKIRWTPVRGRVARFFDDILVLGSKSLPKHYTDRLAPWDLQAVAPYQPQYLAGFRAEGYTVELEEGYSEAEMVMERQIQSDIRRDIGGDEQRITGVDTRVSDITFKHILLPVWMAAYKYNDKTYRFVVNGQSGRVQGERPWSAIKIAFAVVIGVAIAAGVAYVMSQQ